MTIKHEQIISINTNICKPRLLNRGTIQKAEQNASTTQIDSTWVNLGPMREQRSQSLDFN